MVTDMNNQIPTQHVMGTPVLPVVELESAVSFYRNLGFEVTVYDEGYAWVLQGGHELFHLRLCSFEPSANAASCYLHVEDADAWHRTWADEDSSVGLIEDQPWGMREFSLTDPSGNLIRVGHHL